MRFLIRRIPGLLLLASLLLAGCTGAAVEVTVTAEKTQPPFPADTATPGGEMTPTAEEAEFPAATNTSEASPGETSLPQASPTAGGGAYPGPAATATSEGASYPAPAVTSTSGSTPYVGPAATNTAAATRTATPGIAATATSASQPTITPSSMPAATLSSTAALTTTEEVTITATATEYVGQPLGTPQSTGSVVSIWHGLTGDQNAALARIIDSFQDAYPDVMFDITYVPKDELQARYEAASYYGRGPSILLGPTSWGWNYARSGLVADLSAYASDEFLATINRAAVETLYLDGQLIGLPYAQQGYVMYRNISILPEAANTFDELVANAQRATGMGNVGAYLEREALVSSAVLIGQGGKVMDGQGRPAFNSDAALTWLGLLDGYAEAGVAGMHTNRDIELFQDGKIGVIIEGTWQLGGLVEALGAENLAIDAWPAAGTGWLSGYVQTEAVYLNTNTKPENLLSSLRFMGYLLNRDVQSLLGETGLIPTVLEARPRNVHIQQAMKALEGGAAWPMVDETVLQIYWNALDEAINNFFERGVASESALQSAYEMVNIRLNELGGE